MFSEDAYPLLFWLLMEGCLSYSVITSGPSALVTVEFWSYQTCGFRFSRTYRYDTMKTMDAYRWLADIAAALWLHERRIALKEEGATDGISL